MSRFVIIRGYSRRYTEKAQAGITVKTEIIGHGARRSRIAPFD